jgi:hypothetical protein
MRFLVSVLLLTAFAQAGCNIVNPADPIPTFVEVDSFSFVNPDPFVTVGSTRQIRSVYVSYEGKNVGTFDLPARIPVLAGRGGKLQLFPGVDNTAQFVTQVQYPHYTISESQLGPAEGKTVKVNAQTGYTQKTRFVYKEDFENSNDIIVLFGPNFEVTSNPTEVITGSRSGILRLRDTATNAILTSTSSFVPGSNDNFLEIDYRSTAYLRVGVVAGSGNPAYIVTLIPSPAGNKAYISLQLAIGTFGSNPGAFRLVFQSYLENGAASGYVTMDNLKVVTF